MFVLTVVFSGFASGSSGAPPEQLEFDICRKHRRWWWTSWWFLMAQRSIFMSCLIEGNPKEVNHY
jgi:hypothetical protein